MTEMIRNIADEQQKIARELTKVALKNHEAFQKQVDLAMEQTRSSVEMSREVGEHVQRVMVDAMFPQKKADA